MRLRISTFFLVFLTFVLGALAVVLVARYPGQWRWARALSSLISGRAAQRGAESQPQHEGMTSPGQGGEIRVTPGFLQNFGVLTAVAERGGIPVDIRTVGTLAYNDQKITSINTKFAGWIQKAYVNYIGQLVRAGEPLFEIYSPELVATEQEYLVSLKYAQKMKEAAGFPQIADQAKSLVDAAAQRLRLWDITPEQIAELGRTGQVRTTLQIVAPVSGVVVSKLSESLNGVQLNPGTNVYQIADLSMIWVWIQVYEYQVRFLRVGQAAHITLSAFPGRHWTGKVVFLDPAINQQTRTLTAKVEIANPDWQLRPDMYANVEISVPAVSGIRVPSQAVLHTGQRNVLILQKPEGKFEPREVEVGASGGGYTQVLSGIQAGDVIVTSSQFLIDSESNLAAAMAGMGGMQMGPATSQGAKQQEQPGGMPGMEMAPKKNPTAKPGKR